MNLAPAAQARRPGPGPACLGVAGQAAARLEVPVRRQVRFALRGDHLRYDCASFRESLEGAAGKWPAAHDPAESDDVVVECAAAGEVSPGAALCALAVSRGGTGRRVHKQAGAARLSRRDGAGGGGDRRTTCLVRRSGRPSTTRPRSGRQAAATSPTGDDVQKPRAELPPVRGDASAPPADAR